MKKIKTRRFFKVFYTSLGLCAAFLAWLLLFGQQLAAEHFGSVTVGVFALLALAAGSLLAFCFFPYFRGDKRWFAIPSLLTVAFFAGTAILWQVPAVVVI